MKCYHCKREIKPREARAYSSYRVRSDGPLHRRYWCAACNTDEITDAESPREVPECPSLGGRRKTQEAICKST